MLMGGAVSHSVTIHLLLSVLLEGMQRSGHYMCTCVFRRRAGTVCAALGLSVLGVELTYAALLVLCSVWQTKTTDCRL